MGGHGFTHFEPSVVEQHSWSDYPTHEWSVSLQLHPTVQPTFLESIYPREGSKPLGSHIVDAGSNGNDQSQQRLVKCKIMLYCESFCGQKNITNKPPPAVPATTKNKERRAKGGKAIAAAAPTTNPAPEPTNMGVTYGAV